MAKKVIIISPNDKNLDDIFNFTLSGEILHGDISKQHAYDKGINNVTEGYNDLAALNYVVLFSINNVFEFFGGKSINSKQIEILRAFFDDYQELYDFLKLDVCIFNNEKKIESIKSGFKSIDELLKSIYEVKERKEEGNVKEKIQSQANRRKKI